MTVLSRLKNLLPCLGSIIKSVLWETLILLICKAKSEIKFVKMVALMECCK